MGFGAFFIAAQAVNQAVTVTEDELLGSQISKYRQSNRSRFKMYIRRVLYIVRWERKEEEYSIAQKNKTKKYGVPASTKIVGRKAAGEIDKNRMIKMALTVKPAQRTEHMLANISPYIARLKCCETLDANVKNQLPTIVEYECLESGRFIVKQGHAGESYYMIVSGAVDVLIEGEGGVLRRIGVMRSGQGFGEVALVTKGPRTASICTREPTELLRIDRDQFHEVLRASKLQERAKKQEFLTSHPAFQTLSDELMKIFIDNAVIKSFKPSELIIRVGEEKADHVIIVMSGECSVETGVVLDYYHLTDGRFLLDLPSSTRPDISRLRSQYESDLNCNPNMLRGLASPCQLSSNGTTEASEGRSTRSSNNTTSSTRSHQSAKICEEPESMYKKHFRNDVKSKSLKQYHLCLRRMRTKDYFGVSDFISRNNCNVGALKRCECLLLPKILFQKYSVHSVLEGMISTENIATLTVEQAFEAFLKRRHWELYKKKLVTNLVQSKSRRTKHPR